MWQLKCVNTSAWVMGLLLVAGSAWGQTEAAPAGSVAAAIGPDRLGELDWMAGSWLLEQNGRRLEEHWLPSGGGILLGMNRDVRPQRGAFFEYLRIEATTEGLFYVASPRGAPPTRFKAVELSEQRVVFKNPEHDFPQEIIYWKKGDSLCGEIAAEVDGTRRASNWCWNSFDKEGS